MKNSKLYVMRNDEYRKGLIDLIEHVKELKNTKEMTMIEIGSYAAESTRIFADHFKKVISIDPFVNDYDINDEACHHMDFDNVFLIFKENISGYDNIFHIRQTSDEAVSRFNKNEIDFVYIDGLHTYDQVKKDIENYYSLISDNGFISGHDYHPVWGGVVKAVNETLGIPDKIFSDTSWLFKKNNFFINIITPCSRPENLHEISHSINIPEKKYRWIVVCDSEKLPNSDLIPENCEIFCYKNADSISGNAQRNFAIDLVDNGYIYFNDDDTTIHPDLFKTIKNSQNDFISFQQLNSDGTIRLKGNNISVGNIDSHNFIVHYNIVKNNRFILDKYDADGHFAESCFKNSKTPIYIEKPLSVYNKLRITNYDSKEKNKCSN